MLSYGEHARKRTRRRTGDAHQTWEGLRSWLVSLCVVCVWSTLACGPVAGSHLISLHLTSSCQENACVKYISARVTITGESSSWNITETILNGTNIKDDTGRSWALISPLYISIQKLNNTVRYPLIQVNQLCGVYESVHTLVNVTECPPKSLCCPPGYLQTVRTISKNSSLCYNVFAVEKADPKSHVKVTISYMGMSNTVIQQVGDSSNSGGLHLVSYTQPPIIAPFLYFDSFFLLAEPNINNDINAFLVPQYQFSPDVNRIGMTVANYLNATRCSTPIGSTVAVQGGNPNDQFDVFRKYKLSPDPGCTLWLDGSSTNPINASQLFKCPEDPKTPSTLLVELDTRLFKIQRAFGTPTINNFGVYPISSGDKQATLYMDVGNIANETGRFYARTIQCCATPTSCSGVVISPNVRVVVPPGKSSIITFFIKSTIIIDKQGYCTFQILQDQIFYLQQIIYFNTTKESFNSLIPPTDITCRNTSECGRCTVDQILDNLTKICYPVDCSSKYVGRDFYNYTTGICESIIACFTDLIYNPVTNTCEKNATAQVTDPKLREFVGLVLPPLDCGPHGRPDALNVTCICDPGYVLGNSSLGSGVMCRTRPAGDPVDVIGNVTGDSLVLFGVIPPIVWIPVVLSVGITSICVAICCVCFRSRKKEEKYKKVKSHKSDKLKPKRRRKSKTTKHKKSKAKESDAELVELSKRKRSHRRATLNY